MKKRLLPLLIALLLSSCSGGGGGGKSDNPEGNKEFNGVTFESISVPYDGEAHILDEVKGAPDGTSITYDGRNYYIDVGSYNATATLSKSEYKTKTLNATLEITPLEFKVDVTLDSVIVNYDANDHYNDIKAVGVIPEGAEGKLIVKNSSGEIVTTAIDAGVYDYTYEVSKKNYKTVEVKATLTINPLDFSGISCSDVSVKYDGTDHINDVKLIGFQQEGTTIKQTVKDSNGNVVTSAIEVGTYTYSIEVINKNFKTMTLTATLTINPKKDNMPVYVAKDGTIYFSNGLDKNYIYSFKSGVLSRLDFSSPKEFIRSGTTALFITGSKFLNSVKEFVDGTIKVLYSASNINDFVKYNENIFYYASNSITASKSGIYKVDSTNKDDEPIVTKIFEGKANKLVFYKDYLFFTNGNDNNYVYKIDLKTNKSSLVLSEKVHEFLLDNNKLYCSVNGLINDYIGYLDLSSSSTTPVKLTDAAGEYLTISNNKLYFNYTDLFGLIDDSKYGVWSIDLTTKKTTHVLKNQSVNGFDVLSDGTIFFIDLLTLHFYKYVVATNVIVDLLKGFVPAESTPLNLGGKTIAYGNRVYYLNMYAGKTLYVYDENSKTSFQLTPNKVVDFFIYGDYIYFNSVTMLTNNDLYCVNIKLGSEAEKITTNDVRNSVCDGNYIYSTHYNWAGLAGGLSRMKMDGTGYIKFSDINGAKDLTIKDNKLYFINCATGQDNGNIEYISISKINSYSTDLESTILSKNIKNVKQFIFENNYIYYLYNGTIDNSVRRTDFSSLGEGTKLASSKTNPAEMIISGDYIYYYSYPLTSTSSAGFYKVKKDATKDGTQELLLGCKSTYYGTSLAISNTNNLYFLNYVPKLVLGNAHFYQLNLSTKVVTKIN